MDELQKKIQMLLMKKNQEYCQLKLLTARTTVENTVKIEELSKSIEEIILAHNLTEEGINLRLNPKCVNIFKYLMLNTNFKVQERLAEDVIHGHLVDICPSLSPYLFIQILWKLKYEDILLESILHVPLDLSIEIIDIIRSSVEELEFERAINIIFELIVNIYKKFILISNNGTQSSDITENIKILVANFQELLLLLTNENIIQMEKIADLKKYKRSGILLRRIIKVIKDCIEYTGKELKEPEDIEKVYKITFGREPTVRCGDSLIKETVTTIQQDLLNLLLKKIKEIDCNIYLGWAELDDTDNPMISLQKAIGNECYYFVEYLKANKELTQNDHLIECLQQISSKPISEEINSVLTVEELCHGTRQDKKECIKELVSRYREWDETVINCIKEKSSLLDKDDCLNLLEYLTFVLMQTNTEEYLRHVYTIVAKILFRQDLPDIYVILVTYITKHDGRNCLESLYTEETFKDFIVQNTNIKSPKILKIILMFLLKSPKKVLSILLKIAIGYPEYQYVMIAPQNLLLLSPIMCIQEDSNETLLSSALKTIYLENVEWNSTKFHDFLRTMLDGAVFKEDVLINDICVGYLKEDTALLENIWCILTFIRNLCNNGVLHISRNNALELLFSLARTMSSTRKRTDVSIYLIHEVIMNAIYITNHILTPYRLITKDIEPSKWKNIIEDYKYVTEPLDKLYFASLWEPSEKDGIIIRDVIRDYEIRCFFVLNTIKEDQTISNELKTFLNNLNLCQEDFLRHVILRSTVDEYKTFAITYTERAWYSYSCSSRKEAFDNWLRLTTDACRISLEYPHVLPQDSFTYLLSKLVRFIRHVVCSCSVFWSTTNLNQDIYRSVITNVCSLEESIKRSPYSHLFTDLLVRMNNDTRQEITRSHMTELPELLERFVNQCTGVDELLKEPPTNLRSYPLGQVSRHRVIHEFVSACMRVPASSAYECISKMSHLFPAN